ncbi:MAG: prepilin-type N-terminal cleavage/methylation domain-containing protein [Candidatus Omnitrophica bacterium]|nr:prepilin-type N-terminal cleavage/methylation domain-containing protein [Candidatus Omnitrophota bacterium]MDD5513202.1 prepilin-type N-terminal cleavage/methylation domain-containing protein [Candidatus Omnitrophota bacterium]
MHKIRGFTLIEIMVVVSIMIILLTFAIPNILRSRSVANEGAAMANLKSISDACQLYHVNRGAYPETLADLVAPASVPPYIDATLASGHKQGYEYVYERNGLGFTINANPEGVLRGRYYFIDETGIMRVNYEQEAGVEDEQVS